MKIIAEIEIVPGMVKRNGSEVFNAEHTEFHHFAKALYTNLNPGYPKFFKMDALCKLAFLGAEFLLAGKKLHGETAIILGNRHGSIDTDSRHRESIMDRKNYFPSPAVFVYTLPNIMLGEICIRHGITGENSCFLMNAFDPDFFHTYAGNLLTRDGYAECIVGWVDFEPDSYKAHLALIASGDTASGPNVFANFE